MIIEVDKPGSNIEEYLNSLETVLKVKKSSILDMESKLDNFIKLLKKEGELSNRIREFKENLRKSNSIEKNFKQNQFQNPFN